ncbi:MAG: alpha/beta hydrolase-fold protein [Acidobacteriota bacterium]
MSLVIDRLTSDGPPHDEKIRAFLAEHTFPFVEGTSVTFVYYGEADAVYLQHFIYGLPTSQPFSRLAGTNLWWKVLDLPLASRLQYKINVAQGDNHRWILDPRNPERATDPFGANSVVATAGAERPDWTLPDDDTRQGRLVERTFDSAALGGTCHYYLYLPARYRTTRRYPLLVAHDGRDYLRFSSLKTVLDNLIHRLEMPPMIVALVDPGDRLVEYANDERHARFLVEELVPALEDELPLRGEPNGRGIMGASFGGVASFSTAVRYPGFFDRLFLQSGSFAFTDIGENPRGPAFAPVVDFMNQYRSRPERVAGKVFVSCGTYESLIYENRSIVPLLQDTGMTVRYVEARDGHNWENWRDRMREGLSWLFPGPLWMVYE